jgi:hypothetical protein
MGFTGPRTMSTLTHESGMQMMATASRSLRTNRYIEIAAQSGVTEDGS